MSALIFCVLTALLTYCVWLLGMAVLDRSPHPAHFHVVAGLTLVSAWFALAEGKNFLAVLGAGFAAFCVSLYFMYRKGTK